MSCPRQHRPSKFKRLSAVVYPSTIQMPCFPSQQCSGTEGSKVVPHRKLRRRVQGVKRKNSPSHKIALAFDQNLHPFSWSLQPRSPTRKHLAQPIDIYCILYELLDLALHASHLTIFVPIQLLFNTEYSTSCILVALVSLLRVIQT